MPPKRSSTTQTPPTPRLSKLAKENQITAAQELEIKESFTLFSIPSASPTAPTKSQSKAKAKAKEEQLFLLPTKDLRRALTALGTPPSNGSELQELIETVDPEDSGSCDFPTFLAVAALKLNSRSEDSIGSEIEEAWRLFIAHNSGGGGGGGGGGGEGQQQRQQQQQQQKISLRTLRRIAKVLKLEGEVDDGILGDMILEANGGVGVGRGVGRGEFEGVVRRAGGVR
ncbi:MAG: hypothetical protein MMC33_004080 [Icmadophila ericetorum]|nr:hypothetical protein [Icmadophila ericetorum]